MCRPSSSPPPVVVAAPLLGSNGNLVAPGDIRTPQNEIQNQEKWEQLGSAKLETAAGR